MRRLLETLARDHPLIVVLDDLHWADAEFLELVGRLERDTTGPILLLCLARPELDEDAIAPGARDVLRLGPLSSSEIAQLVRDRGGHVIQGSLHRIVERSQGNPLFAEQLLAAIDEGDIDTIPASLVGLLSMRLDRLGPGERNVLRCASVAGLDFDLDVLKGLLPDEAFPFVQRHIHELERKRFIERDGAGRFRFAHVLIQMAAYQTMTQADRIRLHTALAASRPERDGTDPALELTGDGLQSTGRPTRPPSRGPIQTL